MKISSCSPAAKTLVWLMTSIMAALIAGCGGGGTREGSGTLSIFLTDAPACGFDKVYVTVDKIRVNQSSAATDTSAGWSDITLNPAQKIDLLSLNNGVFQNLGQTLLPAGHYTQVRMVLDPNANSVVLTGTTTELPLATPSATQSGIKLINQFDVMAGQAVDLMLDFNACQSIVQRGNGTYALKPVINIVPFTLNGIDGFVDTALLGSNVVVTAQQNGMIVQSTAPNASTGEFLLSRLAPGNYDVVITADGHATAVISAVPIMSSTSVVNISSSGTPITMPVSASHIASGAAALSPADTTVVVYVAAKQTLMAAPTVTVQNTAADDTSMPPGAYLLNLPVAVPLLGQYMTPLPIMLAAQSAVAGQYTLEATATGYQTQQSASLDLSTADVTQDFLLIP